MTFTLRLSNSALQLRGAAELRRADGREVGGVREEDAPARAEVVVEMQAALRAVLLEIRGDIAQSQRRHCGSSHG